MSTITPLTLLLSCCAINRQWHQGFLVIEGWKWMNINHKQLIWLVHHLFALSSAFVLCSLSTWLRFLLSLPSNFTSASSFPRGTSDTGRDGDKLTKSIVIVVMEYEHEVTICSELWYIFLSNWSKKKKSSQSIAVLEIPLKGNAGHAQGCA